jgi:hypothetical protein
MCAFENPPSICNVVTDGRRTEAGDKLEGCTKMMVGVNLVVKNKDILELELTGLCDGLIRRNLDWICGQRC